MPIENSIFESKNDIIDFVRRHYNLIPNNVINIEGGSANCYKIILENCTLFLKEFQSKFNSEMLQKEILICNIVNKAGISTSEYIKSSNQTYIVNENNHCFHLQKYIEGEVYERNTFDDSILFESANKLGKINYCLRQVDFLEEGFPENWFSSTSIERSIQKHQEVILKISSSSINDEYKEKIIRACHNKLNLLRNFDLNWEKFCYLKKENSHGDYNNLQILCDKNKKEIKAIIDFSSAARVPAVWEIIRSYTYGAKECKKGNLINEHKLKFYLDSYMSQNPLPLFDISNMAGFYYYNLLRSSYGLTSTNQKILDFGLWRCQLCDYLGRFYKDLDAYFLNEYKGAL